MEAIFFLFFFGFFLAMVAAFVYWIVALIEVARIPEHQYRAAGTEKVTWILVLALTQVIGALIWLFAKRKAVLAAAGLRGPNAQFSLTPPGWYPEPGTGVLRWWNGASWTEDRYVPPAPPLS